MDNSRVYVRIHFLLYLRDAPIPERRMALTNIVPGQVDTFGVIAERMINGVVSLSRRDAAIIERHRRTLQRLASPTVSFRRKKDLLIRRYSLVPVLLRTPYLIQIIFDELREARDES